MHPPQPPSYTPYSPGRSSAPRVIGILAIIFSCIGLGASMMVTWGPMHDISRWHAATKLGNVMAWLYIFAAASVVIFLLQLVGGILACTYKQFGLRLLTAYAVTALVVIVLDLLILNGFVSGSRMRDSLTMPRSIYAVLCLAWPIVVLALVNTRRSKEACT